VWIDCITTLSQDKESFKELSELVKALLVLSHGQAAVERGFSVNKEIEIENMKGQTLVAQRIICDHVKHAGGILGVDLTKDLLLSARMSRHRYEAYLEDERRKKKTLQERNKRKCVIEEIEEIKHKKRRIESDIESLTKTADGLCEKAEATGKITFVTQANSLKRTAKEKSNEPENLDQNVNVKLDNLKKM
jgi:ribosomal protein S8